MKVREGESGMGSEGQGWGERVRNKERSGIGSEGEGCKGEGQGRTGVGIRNFKRQKGQR